MLAGALFAAVIVVVLVVTLDGSDGPAPGSPEAITDSFASALRSPDRLAIATLSCRPARARVAAAVEPLLGTVTSASRSGAAFVQGSNAVDRITLQADGRDMIGTVALSRTTDAWCVSAVATARSAR
jgi:hypothetical protein